MIAAPNNPNATTTTVSPAMAVIDMKMVQYPMEASRRP
jgi:hypothetical protein